MALGPDDLLLTDRVAVVTGAAVGIGRAISSTFARFGADLALCDRDAENLAIAAAEVEDAGRSALTAQLDVREADQVDAFAAAVRERFGHVDVLVNNAGGGFRSDFMSVNTKGQNALVRENFDSVTLFTRAFVPLMPPDGGSIINLTSVEAHRAAPQFAIYAAQKAAVASLTRSLALELGVSGIRVNCIAPDLIPTPGVGPLEGAAMTAAPIGVSGHVGDCAGAAVFLAGEASRFITGTTVHVDGGTWASGGWRRHADGTWTP
ncbi:MAG: SDR family oxidoreductase [Acidimicrobiia bacterium]|nr:SDR family oxidoreductase [Acidimicrobiia bacterium]